MLQGRGRISRSLTISHFPANQALSGFIIDNFDDNTKRVANGFPITTDASGSGTSEAFPMPATHPASDRRVVIFRDTNGNHRWDDSDVLFQGKAHLAANACENVTYTSPK